MHAPFRLGVGASIKRFLPRSLLGRSLLIILLPLVLVQAVALQMFYGSHLDIVSRRLSSAVAGEIASTLELIRRYPGPRNEDWILRMARDQYDIAMQIEPGAKLVPERRINIFGPMDDDLAERDARRRCSGRSPWTGRRIRNRC